MARADALAAEWPRCTDAMCIAAIPDLLAVVRAAQALSANLNDTPGDDFNVVADALDASLAAFEEGA